MNEFGKFADEIGNIKPKNNKSNKDLDKDKNNHKKKDIEKEQEKMIEKGKGRNSRAFTMINLSYNSKEIFIKLRKRREELAKLNMKIKQDTAKLNRK